jgi:hypothetical protein
MADDGVQTQHSSISTNYIPHKKSDVYDKNIKLPEILEAPESNSKF